MKAGDKVFFQGDLNKFEYVVKSVLENGDVVLNDGSTVATFNLRLVMTFEDLYNYFN